MLLLMRWVLNKRKVNWGIELHNAQYLLWWCCFSSFCRSFNMFKQVCAIMNAAPTLFICAFLLQYISLIENGKFILYINLKYDQL